MYTARVHEHLQSRVRAGCMARVYGCVLAVYTALYMARTRRMRVYTAACRWPCTCRVQGRGRVHGSCAVLLRFSLQKTFYVEMYSYKSITFKKS